MPASEATTSSSSKVADKNVEEKPQDVKKEDKSDPAPSEKKEEDTSGDTDESDSPSPSSSDVVVDMDIFSQLLELDEDDDHEFSKGMAYAYFTQAETTFGELDEAYAAEDLVKLSNLGHFLKGSSAALGLKKVQLTCQDIQHVGMKHDEEKNITYTNEEALDILKGLLKKVKKEYAMAEKWLRHYFADKQES